MNKSLCALICFLVGVLVYSLIRSYCSCDVVEGSLRDENNDKVTFPQNCRVNTPMCGYAKDEGSCGSWSTYPLTPNKKVKVCSDDYSIKDLDSGAPGSGYNCEIYDGIPDKCDDDEKKLDWFKWYMQCIDDPEPCSGGRKPPVPPAPPPVPPAPPPVPPSPPPAPGPTLPVCSSYTPTCPPGWSKKIGKTICKQKPCNVGDCCIPGTPSCPNNYFYVGEEVSGTWNTARQYCPSPQTMCANHGEKCNNNSDVKCCDGTTCLDSGICPSSTEDDNMVEGYKNYSLL